MLSQLTSGKVESNIMLGEKYIPTGNEMISIPDIREKDAAVMSTTFLHMGYKGLITIKGADDAKPLLKPVITVNGIEEPIENIIWGRHDYWIPYFKGVCGKIDIEGTILAPIGERGFIYNIKAINNSIGKADVHVGLKGSWGESVHEINESKPINAVKHIYSSNWNHSIVFDLRSAVSIFSFAPIFDEEMDTSYNLNANSGEVSFTLIKNITLDPGQEHSFNFYWGFGFEEVGASTSAKEMLRKGYEYELDVTRKWLLKRIRKTTDMDMDIVLNTNMFFNFFFASGITMDTEEFVLVTSRSPRYYVSAAYWDRDSLLWSFPSILLVDADYAKEMLEYVFSRQIKNIGIHSRYIDGTVLEPGFELDELCAPILALYSYAKQTGDFRILSRPLFSSGIERILKILASKRHPEKDLYETFLQPTDDTVVHPYLTYDNVLVWKALRDLSEMYGVIGEQELSRDLLLMSEKVQKAVWGNCVVEYSGRKVFAWSLDLKGAWNIYDEPPGSLQLLPHFGFCSENDIVYQNTIDEIRKPEYPYSFSGCNIAEIGCEHAPHPWILSVANSLLCGRKEHSRDILLKTAMDNGIACESVDENTGECTTGAAFATCAGFLAYSVYHAFGSKDDLITK